MSTVLAIDLKELLSNIKTLEFQNETLNSLRQQKLAIMY